MTDFGYSVAIPTVDNDAAIGALAQRIDRLDRIAERALDFAALPFARDDMIIQRRVEDLLLDCGETIWEAGERLHHLAIEHGTPAPTQETWDALTDEERADMIDTYLEVECRTGAWEFNPWGDLIERNCAAFARH